MGITSRRDIAGMLRRHLAERPVEGKTYSLYGATGTSDGYYRAVRELVDRLLSRLPGAEGLLLLVDQAARSRRMIHRALGRGDRNTNLRFVLETAREKLSPFTHAVQRHRESLPLRSRLDRTLSAVEEQYHLSMVQIELANRVYAERFRRASVKLAFLPHCLRDMTRDCRSHPDGIDYVCKGCSRSCWVNGVSKLLRLYDITPYIWMSADISRLFSKLRREGSDAGVVGIACVLELVRGMRLCMRSGIPVVGIPLNANRCARWMGEFHDTSVNLEELASLVDRGAPG